MVHRPALVAASGVASLTLAAGLVLIGFTPQAAPVDAGSAPVADTALVAPSPRFQVDVVYVAPPPKPRDVTVTKVVRTPGGGDDAGEGGGDD
jgi:hypothetical protein